MATCMIVADLSAEELEQLQKKSEAFTLDELIEDEPLPKIVVPDYFYDV